MQAKAKINQGSPSVRPLYQVTCLANSSLITSATRVRVFCHELCNLGKQLRHGEGFGHDRVLCEVRRLLSCYERLMNALTMPAATTSSSCSARAFAVVPMMGM